MEYRCATICQSCFSLLCCRRSIWSKSAILEEDNVHLLGDSCWFNYMPCCLSSFWHRGHLFLPVNYGSRLFRREQSFQHWDYLGKRPENLAFSFKLRTILFIIYLTSRYQIRVRAGWERSWRSIATAHILEWKKRTKKCCVLACLSFVRPRRVDEQSVTARAFWTFRWKEKHGGDVSSNQRVPGRGIDKGRGRGCGRQILKVYSVLGLKGRSGKMRQLLFDNDEALLWLNYRKSGGLMESYEPP